MIDEKGGNDFGLAPEVFIVCDSIKRLWRARHPQIVSYWPQLRDTAIKAIETPGQEFPCRKVTMVRTNNWLRIILPSGRNLCYPQPRAKGKSISYMGVNPYTRRWQRIPTYGGKLLENITQAASRDTFTSSMPEIEKRGYDTVLLVHDENVTEAPDSSEFSGEQLAGLMSVVPSWATGLPLAAAGYETYRYRKD
jgi:DNA polymerase